MDACPPGDLLITHAGTTAGAWRLLGQPASAAETVALINEAQAPVVWREGGIITGVDDSSAGPIWALAASEVYQSWSTFDTRMSRAEFPTFAQTHGHTSGYSWRHDQWFAPMDLYEKRSIATLLVDERCLITRVQIGDHVFFGTDPGSEATARSVTLPLVLTVAAHGTIEDHEVADFAVTDIPPPSALSEPRAGFVN